MFTYQVRPRIFRHEPDRSLAFPAPCEVRFHLQPLQPFGLEAGGGRTAVRAVAASALFNANTGAHTVESREPLQSLDVTIEDPVRRVCLIGNVLSVFQHLQSGHELAEMVEGIYFGLPLLLSQIESGAFDVAPYTVGKARPEALAAVERIAERTPPDAV